jgi:hypothetical protein
MDGNKYIKGMAMFYDDSTSSAFLGEYSSCTESGSFDLSKRITTMTAYRKAAPVGGDYYMCGLKVRI